MNHTVKYFINKKFGYHCSIIFWYWYGAVLASTIQLEFLGWSYKIQRWGNPGMGMYALV